MRAIRTTAAIVVTMLGTMQLLAAQELLPVRTGAGSPQSGLSTSSRTGAISGRAKTAGKDRSSNRPIQLRDVQSGRVVATGTTDNVGAFSFSGIQPGTYVVEVVGDQSVLAASSALTLQAGESLSIVVSLPIATAAGILGSTVATASMIAAGAAAAGVLAVRKVGDPTCPQ
jgi:hypothetical protein